MGVVYNALEILPDLVDGLILDGQEMDGLYLQGAQVCRRKILGIDWTLRQAPAGNEWRSVCYGNGLFVAVASTGVGTRVMTSPDGINWTIRQSAADIDWLSVCYGNGLFVAVALTGMGTGNHVMTSPDGINWTLRQTPADNYWRSVCYGNGLFVAVAYTGGDRVMTSPDGINWTARSAPVNNSWSSVCYGNGLFVAVAYTGGDRVMTSPDGINWTLRQSAANVNWYSVCYGNGLFVAVANTGAGDRVMTSPDGITWTLRQTPAGNNYWMSVCYGNGLFVAVAYAGTEPRIMTSPDGITWTLRHAPVDNSWYSVCYGSGMFVVVAFSGVGSRVMTSGYVRADDRYALVSTGTQYIDTGIPYKADMTISVDYQWSGIGTNRSLLGSRNASSPYNRCDILLVNPTTISAPINLTSHQQVAIGDLGTARNVVSLTPTAFLFNGAQALTRTALADNIHNIYLFSSNINGTASGLYSGKIFGLKITSASIGLVRDLVPVPAGDTTYSTTPAPSNCMWDKVTQQYFTNRGSGEFEIEQT